MTRHPCKFPRCSAIALAAAVALLAGCKKDTGEAEIPKARVVEISDEAEVPATAAPAPEPIDPAIPELKINKSAQVAILCYHDFITGASNGQMKINIDHFRKQMQAIKGAKLPVISLSDFMKWRRGEKDIPDPSVMITIDDGYNSVYLLAMPVLKEFGYPFSIFLYKKYVNGGGRALTTAQIKEILANGGELGSHSVSHPLNIARPGNRTPEEYEQFVISELRDSKQFLEDMFMIPVPTYAHPGGTFTKHILELGTQFGYEFMFSVNPAKATWDSPAGLIPRYVVHGNDPQDRNFRAALSFRGINDGEIGKQLLGSVDGAEPLVKTTPAPNATIASRQPLIVVDVSKLTGIDPASVKMKVTGIGDVPCKYEPSTGHITYQVVERLRTLETHVHVSFQRAGEGQPDMVSWKFSVDLVAAYLPHDEQPEAAPKAATVTEQAEESGSDDANPAPAGAAPAATEQNASKAPANKQADKKK